MPPGTFDRDDMARPGEEPSAFWKPLSLPLRIWPTLDTGCRSPGVCRLAHRYRRPSSRCGASTPSSRAASRLQKELECGDRALRPSARRRFAAAVALRDVWCGGRRVADCVLERRQPPARQGRGACQGDGSAGGPRGQQTPATASAVDRNAGALPARNCGRPRCRELPRRPGAHTSSARNSVNRRYPPRLSGLRLRGARRRGRDTARRAAAIVANVGRRALARAQPIVAWVVGPTAAPQIVVVAEVACRSSSCAARC